jgi:Nif-specific regulatory protein
MNLEIVAVQEKVLFKLNKMRLKYTMSVKNPYESLVAISENITRVQDTAVLLDTIMDVALETLSAERGFILLNSNGKKDGHQPVAARNMSKKTISSIQNLSTSVVNQVLKDNKPLLSIDAQSDDRFQGAESVVIQQIKSILCTPLILNGKSIGVIYMDSRVSNRQFDKSSLEFLKAFSRQATIAITNTRLLENLKSENKRLKKQIDGTNRFPEIIGKSESMLHIFDLIRDIADSTASILIEGESGTGKELVARALHVHSSRSENPFIPIFCGSLSENLLESELFGHKKGAFTGASENKIGLFEEADKGTVFLDEIADISINIQTKLLRVIQEGEVKRVGETDIRNVDVRIVSATNKDLKLEVENGNFREDLFYRLNVINIKMPPLRERRNDISLLADHFLRYYALKNKKNIHSLSKEAIEHLNEYHWPGNVRELENAIERAVILAKGSELDSGLFQLAKVESHLPLGKTLDEINKFAIIKTIEMLGNNRTKAAKVLGVSRRWLQYRLKDWGMVDGN